MGAEICAFLGLEDAIDYAETSKARNATRKETLGQRLVLRNPIGNSVFKRLPYCVRAWLRHDVFPKFPKVAPMKLDEKDQQALRAALHDDIHAFHDTFGVNVERWGF